MNTSSSLHRVSYNLISMISQLSVVCSLFTMALMPIGAGSSSERAYIDPVAVYPVQPAVSSFAWIQALPARERFLAEKLTRLELLQGTVNVQQLSIPSECSYPMSQQQIAALAAQTGASRLTIFKDRQAECFPYTGHW